MSTTNDALLTVVFPVFHLRSDLADCIRSWTKRQSLERTRYRVIVAAPDDAPGLSEDDMRPLLAEQDVFIRVRGDVDAALWNAGAALAATPWLVITEGHCSAKPGCLAAVEQWIRTNPDAQAGNFAATHPGPDIIARLSERWFDEIHAEWRRGWRRLHRSGFVLRSDIFHAACGFEADYCEFAVPMLAARLNGRGVELVDVPGAAVEHHDEHRMAQRHDTIADYVRNEIRARGRNDPVFFERHFGFSSQWSNQLFEESAGARGMARALLSAAVVSPRRGRHLLRQFAALAMRSCIDARRRVALKRSALKCDEFAVERLPLPNALKWARFMRALARLVDLEQLGSLRRHPLYAGSGGAFWPIEDIGPAMLSGVFALEKHGERLFRWTAPGAMIRIAAQSSAGELAIDTGGLRGDPMDAALAVVVGGRALPRELISSAGDDLIIRLPEPIAEAAGEGIFVVSAPLRPRRYDREDDRELGMPVFSMRWRPLPGREASYGDPSP